MSERESSLFSVDRLSEDNPIYGPDSIRIIDVTPYADYILESSDSNTEKHSGRTLEEPEDREVDKGEELDLIEFPEELSFSEYSEIRSKYTRERLGDLHRKLDQLSYRSEVVSDIKAFSSEYVTAIEAVTDLIALQDDFVRKSKAFNVESQSLGSDLLDLYGKEGGNPGSAPHPVTKIGRLAEKLVSSAKAFQQARSQIEGALRTVIDGKSRWDEIEARVDAIIAQYESLPDLVTTGVEGGSDSSGGTEKSQGRASLGGTERILGSLSGIFDMEFKVAHTKGSSHTTQ